MWRAQKEESFEKRKERKRDGGGGGGVFLCLFLIRPGFGVGEKREGGEKDQKKEKRKAGATLIYCSRTRKGEGKERGELKKKRGGGGSTEESRKYSPVPRI